VEAGFNFIQELRALVEQVPDGMLTTPRAIANALGDPKALRAVSEALRVRKVDGAGKVAAEPITANVFRDFSSGKPLKRLAEFQLGQASLVDEEDGVGKIGLVAGVDAAYSRESGYAACVVIDSDLEVVETGSAEVEASFPYIPGYLSYREAPVVRAAVEEVSGFDVLLVNGHGVAHPRGYGLASHVGLALDVPSIGVAGRRLVGEEGVMVEGQAPIRYGGRVVGVKLRMGGHSPIYVSVGHRVSLESSVRIVRRTMSDGRFPEPLREAHRLVNMLRRG